MPGVTQEGAVYFLPKTAVNVVVKIEKATYTPGDFAPYAERFLRLSNPYLKRLLACATPPKPMP